MSHLPRLPVRFVKSNNDLLKSQEGVSGQRVDSTDYRHDVDVPKVSGGVVSSYRVPSDRTLGNHLFCRYVDGTLDVEGAGHKIIDAIHKVKDSGGVDILNSSEKVALSVMFPSQFNFGDVSMVGSVARVQLRITPEEVQAIRMFVASHLAEELNYNAGFGGGSVPGRSTTRA